MQRAAVVGHAEERRQYFVQLLHFARRERDRLHLRLAAALRVERSRDVRRFASALNTCTSLGQSAKPLRRSATPGMTHFVLPCSLRATGVTSTASLVSLSSTDAYAVTDVQIDGS